MNIERVLPFISTEQKCFVVTFYIISPIPCCVQFVSWGFFGEFISSALTVSLMIIINSVSKQETFLHWGGGFQGQFK